MSEIVPMVREAVALTSTVAGAVVAVKKMTSKSRQNKSDLQRKATSVKSKKAKAGSGDWHVEFWQELAKKCPEMAGRELTDRYYWTYCTRRGARYNFAVTHTYARVEIFIDSGNPDRNFSVFDSILKHQKEIVDKVGNDVVFERLEERRAKRIKKELYPIDVSDRSNWARAIKFMVENMPKFVSVIDKYLPNGKANCYA